MDWEVTCFSCFDVTGSTQGPDFILRAVMKGLQMSHFQAKPTAPCYYAEIYVLCRAPSKNGGRKPGKLLGNSSRFMETHILTGIPESLTQCAYNCMQKILTSLLMQNGKEKTSKASLIIEVTHSIKTKVVTAMLTLAACWAGEITPYFSYWPHQLSLFPVFAVITYLHTKTAYIVNIFLEEEQCVLAEGPLTPEFSALSTHAYIPINGVIQPQLGEELTFPESGFSSPILVLQN